MLGRPRRHRHRRLRQAQRPPRQILRRLQRHHRRALVRPPQRAVRHEGSVQVPPQDPDRLRPGDVRPQHQPPDPRDHLLVVLGADAPLLHHAGLEEFLARRQSGQSQSGAHRRREDPDGEGGAGAVREQRPRAVDHFGGDDRGEERRQEGVRRVPGEEHEQAVALREFCRRGGAGV